MSAVKAFLWAVLAGLMAVPAAAGAQEAGIRPPVVEAARQVTDNPVSVRAHATPAVAVNPTDDRVIAVGEGEGYGSTCALHVSTDGGTSWRTVPIKQTGEYSRCVYANFGPIVDVAFGSDGTLHYAYSGFNPATYRSRMFLARTKDLGNTIETTQLPAVEQDLSSKGQFGADALPSVVVDPSRPERVAVGWMSNNGTWNVSDDVRQGKRYYYDIFSRPYVATSTDGGKTFGPAVDVGAKVADESKERGWMNEPHLAVGTDGTLLAFYGENQRPLPEGSTEQAPPVHLWASSSKDWGKTWTQKAVHTRPAKNRDWLGQPSPGVDPASGRVYVVWDDRTDAKPRVAFSTSSDGGATWSPPTKLNDVEPQRTWNFCEFCPSLRVAPNGRIDVAWYDWRNDPTYDPSKGDDATNAFQDVYATYSTDGGKTWARNFKVSDRAIDRRLGVSDTMGLKGNIGLASTNAAAIVAWDDTRNGNEVTQSQDVYLTRVRFTPETAVAPAQPPRLLWSLLGAGAALAVGGIVLFVAMRSAVRPRPESAGQHP